MNYYQLALKQAKLALSMNEVPIGCIIIHNNNIISTAHNLTNTLRNPLAHAELLALKKIKNYDDLTCYVNVEPCVMCADILKKIGCKVIYGIKNKIFGASAIDITLGVGECIGCEESVELLKRFYDGENMSAPVEKRKMKRMGKVKK